MTGLYGSEDHNVELEENIFVLTLHPYSL